MKADEYNYDFSPWWPSYMKRDCSKCGAKKGERCRTLTTGRVTDSHYVRVFQ